jgi:lysophospholipase L1-like esterase
MSKVNRRTARLATPALVAAMIAGAVAACPGNASATSSTRTRADAAAHVYRDYVALGDSYTSSDGYALNGLPSTRYVPLGCAQATSDYPHQVAQLLHVAQFTDASCGGATTKDFTHPQSVAIGSNPPQFSRLTKRTDLVTMGIGGNDVGLVALATSCLEAGLTGSSCQQANTVDGVDQVAKKIKATRKVIVAAINGIHERSPHARVIVVNYLDAVPNDGKGCYPYIPVKNSDMAWFTARYKQMNRMLDQAAHRAHAQLADTYTPTIGHDICQSPTVRYVDIGGPSLNPIGSVAAPLHPDQAGANAQAAIVYARIRRG